MGEMDGGVGGSGSGVGLLWKIRIDDIFACRQTVCCFCVAAAAAAAAQGRVACVST